MKNGIVDPIFFELLDDIKTKYGYSDQKWAKASNIAHAPRISELRRIAIEARTGKSPEKIKKIGRAMSARKILDLLKGLKLLAGEKAVTRELLKRLDETNDGDERLWILLSLLQDEDKAHVETYLRTVLQARDHN